MTPKHPRGGSVWNLQSQISGEEVQAGDIHYLHELLFKQQWESSGVNYYPHQLLLNQWWGIASPRYYPHKCLPQLALRESKWYVLLSSPPASLQEVRGFQKRDVLLTICSSTSREGVQAGDIILKNTLLNQWTCPGRRYLHKMLLNLPWKWRKYYSCNLFLNQ